MDCYRNCCYCCLCYFQTGNFSNAYILLCIDPTWDVISTTALLRHSSNPNTTALSEHVQGLLIQNWIVSGVVRLSLLKHMRPGLVHWTCQQLARWQCTSNSSHILADLLFVLDDFCGNLIIPLWFRSNNMASPFHHRSSYFLIFQQSFAMSIICWFHISFPHLRLHFSVFWALFHHFQHENLASYRFSLSNISIVAASHSTSPFARVGDVRNAGEGTSCKAERGDDALTMSITQKYIVYLYMYTVYTCYT